MNKKQSESYRGMAVKIGTYQTDQVTSKKNHEATLD
jgi:hypothetical protein